MAVKRGNGGAHADSGERDPHLDRLYRDTARDTPPAHLDAAILAAARREVGSRPRALSTRLRRWRVPVSIAAVVVLSVSLVTLVREEGSEALLRDARSPAVRPPARTAEPAEQAAEPAQAPEPRKRATAAPEEYSFRRDEGPAGTQPQAEGERERTRSAAESAPGADTRAVPQGGAGGGTLSSQARESPQRPEADQPQPQEPSIGVRGSDAAPPAAARRGKPMERRNQAEQALAKKGPPVWHGLEQEPPQKWVERLAELRRQGRTGEAEELMAELERRFPDHPLPDGLK
jgi:resuscitation-promoting factor RpfA